MKKTGAERKKKRRKSVGQMRKGGNAEAHTQTHGHTIADRAEKVNLSLTPLLPQHLHFSFLNNYFYFSNTELSLSPIIFA